MIDVEKAHIMLKLSAKNNLGNKYDRLEHFKRFPNLKDCIKELSKIGWIIIHKKPQFTGISLNTHYKREIIEHIEKYLPQFKGYVK